MPRLCPCLDTTSLPALACSCSQTTKTLAEIQHSFIDLFNRNSNIRCSLRKRRKETWHRVSSIFRTPFLNQAEAAAAAAQAAGNAI